MNCDSLRVVFAGTPEFAAEALDALIHSGHEVVGVLSQPDRPAGRGRKLTPSAVKQRAQLAGLPVHQPASLREAGAVASLAELEPDVLVVAAYGLILPQAVLDLPALGCLNIHASLLPRWRGAAPIQRAILAGDTETGICIMRMDAGLDTGDVLRERRLMIGPDETAAELHDRLAKLGADCLLEALPQHCAGTLQARAQAGQGVSYAEKLSKSEGRLDFSDSALVLHRRVRAFNPWPVAEAVLCGERVRIWKSRLVLGTAVGQAPQPQVASVNPGTSLPGTIIGIRPDALEVSTGDGLIELLELQWPGRKVQGAAAFSQGRKLAGERFTAA